MPANRQKKISGKYARPRSREASRRIYQSGRDNLFNVRFQERRTPLRLLRPPSRLDVQMAAIALVTVGLLGDGFMVYVLFQWMRDTMRNRNH
jgi:hypothetical protein